MSEALSRAQPYIQLEEAMRASSNPSVKPTRMKRNQSPLVKLPIMLLTDIGPASLKEADALYSPVKSNSELQVCRIFHSIKVLLHWSFQSMKSSIPLKINHESDTQSQSNPICHCPGRRSTICTTSVKGTKLSTAGTSKDTWKSSSNKAFSRSTFLLLRRFLEGQTPRLLRNRTWSLRTGRSTELSDSIQMVYTLPNLLICIAFWE